MTTNYEIYNLNSFQYLLADLDNFLTNKTYNDVCHTSHSQKFSEERFLLGSSSIYYLSDGGYSRIGFNHDTKKLFLTSNSLNRPKKNWESAKELREAIEERIDEYEKQFVDDCTKDITRHEDEEIDEEEDEEMNLKQFIKRHNIRAEVSYGTIKPIPEEMRNMDPWTIVLKKGRRRMTVPFYTGYGCRDHGDGEPTAYDVLYCLQSDAFGSDQCFEDWCHDFCYDDDSRKAKRIYKNVQQQTHKLKQFMQEHYEDFINAQPE
jgi:hypothetical protein